MSAPFAVILRELQHNQTSCFLIYICVVVDPNTQSPFVCLSANQINRLTCVSCSNCGVNVYFGVFTPAAMGRGKTFFFRSCGNRVNIAIMPSHYDCCANGVKGAARAPVSIMKNQSTISTQVREMITSRTLHLSGISHRFHFLNLRMGTNRPKCGFSV